MDILSLCVWPHCCCKKKGLTCLSCVTLSPFGRSQKPRLFIHMVSSRYTCRHIPSLTTRMLINTSDSMVNNQTFKLSIIVGYLVGCVVDCFHLSPHSLCRQNRSISMDFWKYAAVICCGILCGPFCSVCTNSQKKTEEEKYRGIVFEKPLLAPHFEWRRLGPQ